jgi:LPXTG-motif cell wall-anchored protein
VLIAAQAAADFEYDVAAYAAGVQASDDAAAAAAAAAPAAAPAAAAPAEELPRTGSTTTMLAVIALALLVCGAVATMTGRRLKAVR